MYLQELSADAKRDIDEMEDIVFLMTSIIATRIWSLILIGFGFHRQRILTADHQLKWVELEVFKIKLNKLKIK